MVYNDIRHILDHSRYVINNMDKYYPGRKFIGSIDRSYFIKNGITNQDEIDEIMIEISRRINGFHTEKKEKNGANVSVSGKRKPKDAQRKVSFRDSIVAYHNAHFDSSLAVEPHIHIAGGKQARFGKGFSYLREAMVDIAKEHDLSFHFMESPRSTGLREFELKKIEQVDWTFQMKGEKITSVLLDTKRLDDYLELLNRHYIYSGNISFFIKHISVLHHQLHIHGIDYVHNGVNLKENIYFKLNDAQLDKIHKIQNEDGPINIDMASIFDREILKYLFGFETQAMNVIAKRFNISMAEEIKSRIVYIEKPHKKRKNLTEKSNFIQLVKKDIHNAVSIANSEKNFKQELFGMGYRKVVTNTIKTSENKRKKYAFSVTTAYRSKVKITFHDLGYDWEKILLLFQQNQKKKQKQVQLKSALLSYKKKKITDTETMGKLHAFVYSDLILLTMVYKPKPADHEKVSNIAIEKFEIVQSKEYNIATYTSKEGTVFVDYGGHIILKQSVKPEEDIAAMIEVLKQKGCDMEKLEFIGKDQYIEKVKKQITDDKKTTIGKKEKKVKKKTRSIRR